MACVGKGKRLVRGWEGVMRGDELYAPVNACKASKLPQREQPQPWIDGKEIKINN